MPTSNLGSLEKVLRFGEGRRMKRLADQAAYIGTLEPEFEALSDEELAAKTVEFKERVANGEPVEELLFEAFAAVREAFKRTMGIRLFDVQLMGGIVLHEGDIAEQKTGEGKTFVAVQALYLNALTGNNVHLVTVNDYLAKRDPNWTKPVWDALGMSVGSIQNMMPFAERRVAYAADVTYGTNSEFGFDYLRDNMAVSLDGVVQRGHHYAIVDEVDSILIDEARTPLIISGEPETAAEIYYTFARIAKTLRGHPSHDVQKGEDPDADYLFDEKRKNVAPLHGAIEAVERALKVENLYDPRNAQLVNHLNQALKAQALYHRDVEYVVQEGEVKIVDEFTGRIMEGRRWSEGLHQAVEAKEGVRIQEEHVTLATITLQNYFRLYERLAGMTGTAKTEEKEFVEIYNLDVVEVPTNRDVVRKDENDLIFKTKDAKFNAVVADITERHRLGQPVLVGSIAVETSEYLSERLTRAGVPHNVLNAKQHEREAMIIAQAGRKHAVTIATNMAGRGVDIVLGGNPEYEARQQLVAKGLAEDSHEFEEDLRRRVDEARSEWEQLRDEVRDLGGVYVLGTERHESRRIDNQLRGRSGRQGDPGETRFYLSGQDDLVRLFAGDRIYNIMERFKLPEDEPMEAKILSNQIEGAQKKVEEQNFVSRKNVLKYDDVLNVQRQVIYEQRRRVLEGEDLSEDVGQWIDEVVEGIVLEHLEAEYAEEWDLEALCAQMHAVYGSEINAEELREEVELERAALIEEFQTDARDAYEEKEQQFGTHPVDGTPLLREVERYLVLQTVDLRWREHLENMEYLRDGIHLRAMAQKDPLVEYRHEGHIMFEELSSAIREEVVTTLFHVQLAPDAVEALQEAPSAVGDGKLAYEHESLAGAQAIAAAGASTATPVGSGGGGVGTMTRRTAPAEKVGRNDPCWCGSGKKFKKCHGA
ncbi:MAG: preprotein translocase subunit SecA [Gaiellaceae bacterium]